MRIFAILILTAVCLSGPAQPRIAHASGPATAGGARGGSDAAVEDLIRVHGTPSTAGLIERLHREHAAVRDLAQRKLGAALANPFDCHLAANTSEAAGILGDVLGRELHIPDRFAGWAVPGRGVMVLNLDALVRGDPGDPVMRTFRHEYGHLVIGEWLEGSGRRLPLWLEEGICQWMERSAYAATDEVLAVRAGLAAHPGLDRVSAMAGGDDLALGYALAEDAARTLLSGLSDDRRLAALRVLVAKIHDGLPFDDAFVAAFGRTPAQFEAHWREISRGDGITPLLEYLGSQWFSLLFGFGGLLLVVAVIRKRRRQRREIEQLEAEAW
jgi:hypothetical protein